MKIYESEKPLQEKITASVKATVIAPVRISSKTSETVFANSVETIRKNGCDKTFGSTLANVTSNTHPDLMYASAILVSTVMNLNDDVFLPKDTWAAKDTPVNTPFDNEHKQQDIIGHIIAARVLDSEGKLVESNDPPDYFDIEVDFVIYKSLFPAIAEDIATKAPKNEKFVSMEATMENFDYALITENNEFRIIARNEATAFLTKYLRIYGGSGKFENYRVGRVLRDFRFTGMGSVSEPANPASEYTSVNNVKASRILEDQNDSLAGVFKTILHLSKGNVMVIENLEQAKAAIEKLEATAAELETKVKASETKLTEATVAQKAAAEALVAEQTKIGLLEQEVAAAKKAKEDKEKQLDEEKKKSDEKTKANETLQKTVAEYQKAQNKANRTKAMVDLGFEVSEADSVKYAEMSEDTFATVLDFAKSAKKKNDKKDEKDTDKGDNDADDAKSKAAAEAAAKALAEANKTQGNGVDETALAAKAAENKMQDAMTALASVLNSRKENVRVKKLRDSK